MPIVKRPFLFANDLVDINIRPLKIQEMLLIQGFPGAYKLKGTMTEQKKYVGNSVEVTVGIALFVSIDGVINNQ